MTHRDATDEYISTSRVAEPRTTPGETQSVLRLSWRAARLRCVACGRAPIFRGRFAMHARCAACGRRFNRDPGYLLGSIYFNYGITATIVVAAYFTMFFRDWLTDSQRLIVLSGFAILFPTWFFRYARALWMAFDERWDPWPNEEELRSEERAARSEQF